MPFPSPELIFLFFIYEFFKTMDELFGEEDNKENKENEGGEEKPKIKATLYHLIGKICDSETSLKNKTFSKEYLASLAEVVFAQGELFANDMEAFCRHSKRTIINMDDVKLIARRNGSLVEQLDQQVQQINGEQKAKVKGKRRKTDHVVLDDDD